MKIWKTAKTGNGFVGFRKPNNVLIKQPPGESEDLLEAHPYEDLEKPSDAGTEHYSQKLKITRSPGKTQSKRGRPKKAPQHLRYRNISVCLSEQEEYQWKKAAKQAQKSLSKWIRDKVNHPKS
tara:strand:- start:2402 stop:2770 length:369 start_codon:yes stop_codon:yes gene_type:complete